MKKTLSLIVCHVSSSKAAPFDLLSEQTFLLYLFPFIALTTAAANGKATEGSALQAAD